MIHDSKTEFHFLPNENYDSCNELSIFWNSDNSCGSCNFINNILAMVTMKVFYRENMTRE